MKIKTTLLALLCATTFSYAQDNSNYVPNELLIQLHPNQSIDDLAKKFPSFSLEVDHLVSAPMRLWLVRFDSNKISTVQMQDAMQKESSVIIADYNYYLDLRETTPNDPQLTQQWHHVNTGQTGGTADADIDSDLAWDMTTGGLTATNDDIVVCIIESANMAHNDLVDNLWTNLSEIAGNSIDDDGNGYVDDIMGWNAGGNNGTVGYGTSNFSTSHGTNCVGMFAAKGDNTLGVVGANWNLKVMISTYSQMTQSAVIESLTYPLVQRKLWNSSNGAQGAFVVATSASWGIDNADPTAYPLWCDFYDTLGFYGIINVAATTNNNTNVDSAGDMPTACSSPYMVGVGRTDHNDGTAGGYGQTTILLGAPGINVRTTANGNQYTTTTGTSFACPLTAGVVALAYSIPCPEFMQYVRDTPQAGADMVLKALKNGVDQKPNLATKFISGGRLNAKNTLDSLMQYSCLSGLNEAELSNLEIYPNPVSSTIILSTESDLQKSVEFYDLNGRLIFVKGIEIGENNINVEQWKNGSYFFRVRDTNKYIIQTGKIEVIH